MILFNFVSVPSELKFQKGSTKSDCFPAASGKDSNRVFLLGCNSCKVRPVFSFRAQRHVPQTGLTWPLSKREADYLPETKALPELTSETAPEHSANGAHLAPWGVPHTPRMCRNSSSLSCCICTCHLSVWNSGTKGETHDRMQMLEIPILLHLHVYCLLKCKVGFLWV